MNWEDFKSHLIYLPSLEMSLDTSKIGFTASFFNAMQPLIIRALHEMDMLEKGNIANPDEKRMVGHYWLRNFGMGPSPDIRKALHENLLHIQQFSKEVLSGALKGEKGAFKYLLCIGIGGSALGPQLLTEALGLDGSFGLKPYFIDNTDPDGISRVLDGLKGVLGQTLVVVISKSGGTPEPRNALVEVQEAYRSQALSFQKHVVAVTGEGSLLDKQAVTEGWLCRFPLWEWVGGRTSLFSSVGLLPAALQGIDIASMLGGATEMDIATRHAKYAKNPAMMLALAWYAATQGHGMRNMVVIPYKDNLSLFARYLQQLIMESLGKKHDLQGNIVHQGLTVYGNKGSTDQHAYIQQLRDGLDDFFATFVEVLKPNHDSKLEVEPGLTSGDFLEGFLLGTRKALSEIKRLSITITLNTLSAQTLGALVALYERAVGFYASFVGINAYHQPGVEAGKKAAAHILELKKKILALLKSVPDQKLTVVAIAEALKTDEPLENIFKLLEYLSANGHLKRHIEAPLTNSYYQINRT